MFDGLRLVYEMKRRAITREEMCQYLGVSHTTLTNKLQQRTEFTRLEIQKLLVLLGRECLDTVFFVQEVS